MNSVGSINLSHFIVTIISLGTFFFIGSFIPIEALKDYDNLTKLVNDIRNGNIIDDKISLNDFKGSGAYQDADKNIQDCINLAAKIGHNLRDVEIVHCFDDANYYKDKYLNVSAPQNKVPQRESVPEKNVTQANVTQKVPEPEIEKQSVPQTNVTLTTPQSNVTLTTPQSNVTLTTPQSNVTLTTPQTNASLNAPQTNASLTTTPQTNASLNAPQTNASLNAPQTNASLTSTPQTNASRNQ
jgi:hypothetical protein